jgi:uncharacterized protein YkwD
VRHPKGSVHPRHASHHAHGTNPRRAATHRPATASDSCPGANLRPDEGNLEVVLAATLCLVNGERARFGAPPLVEDARLQSAAEAHSRDMVEGDYFEHVGPSGQTPLARIRAAGFIPNSTVGFVIGENIAWGTLWLASPREIVKAWMASPGHRANILDRAYRDTGLGIDPALPRSMSHGQAGGIYTQDFGSILG